MLEEAEMLVERMKADTKVNYEEDWKLLTMFVGGNDLCGSCEVGGGPSATPVFSKYRSKPISHVFNHLNSRYRYSGITGSRILAIEA